MPDQSGGISDVIDKSVQIDIYLQGIKLAILLNLTAIITLVLGYNLANLIDFLAKLIKASRAQNIKRPKSPEYLLLKIADFLPSRPRKAFYQEARDLKTEYEDAITLGKIRRAKVIVIYYYVGVFWSIVIWISQELKKVIKIS